MKYVPLILLFKNFDFNQFYLGSGSVEDNKEDTMFGLLPVVYKQLCYKNDLVLFEGDCQERILNKREKEINPEKQENLNGLFQRLHHYCLETPF